MTTQEAKDSDAVQALDGRDAPDYVKNIDGFRKLAQSLGAASISLGSLSLALLVLARRSDDFAVSEVALYGLQLFGVVFIYCSALCIDWIVDSFSDLEWRAAEAFDPAVRKIRATERAGGAISNQFRVRLALFSGGYAVFSLTCTLLVFATVTVYAGSGLGTLLLAATISIFLFAKMMTETLSKGSYVIAALLAYGAASAIFGAFVTQVAK